MKDYISQAGGPQQTLKVPQYHWIIVLAKTFQPPIANAGGIDRGNSPVLTSGITTSFTGP